MLLHGSVTVPGYNACVICSLDRVTAEEANHMLVTCALVLVVSFSSDQNHGLSRTESVSCCFDFSNSQVGNITRHQL